MQGLFSLPVLYSLDLGLRPNPPSYYLCQYGLNRTNIIWIFSLPYNDQQMYWTEKKHNLKSFLFFLCTYLDPLILSEQLYYRHTTFLPFLQCHLYKLIIVGFPPEFRSVFRIFPEQCYGKRNVSGMRSRNQKIRNVFGKK